MPFIQLTCTNQYKTACQPKNQASRKLIKQAASSAWKHQRNSQHIGYTLLCSLCVDCTFNTNMPAGFHKLWRWGIWASIIRNPTPWPCMGPIIRIYLSGRHPFWQFGFPWVYNVTSRTECLPSLGLLRLLIELREIPPWPAESRLAQWNNKW